MGIRGHWSDFYSADELGIEPDEIPEPEKEEKEKYEAWKRIEGYIKKCGYDWTYERLEHDYLKYYLNGSYCSHTFMDVVKNNESDCHKVFT